MKHQVSCLPFCTFSITTSSKFVWDLFSLEHWILLWSTFSTSTMTNFFCLYKVSQLQLSSQLKDPLFWLQKPPFWVPLRTCCPVGGTQVSRNFLLYVSGRTVFEDYSWPPMFESLACLWTVQPILRDDEFQYFHTTERVFEDCWVMLWIVRCLCRVRSAEGFESEYEEF
jgi:hypothetical protein